jgi:hypothetical protein
MNALREGEHFYQLHMRSKEIKSLLAEIKALEYDLKLIESKNIKNEI